MGPDEILARFGISEPQEIDIEAIAQDLGATVVYEPLDGCEARVIGYGDEAFISVNPSGSRGRERFGAAHELGHWMRDRGHVSACKLDEMVEWGRGREMRANRFAQDLLLPARMFSPRAAGRPATVETIRDLSDQFDTSMTATAIRMVEHGPVPAIIACYSSSGLRWNVKGPLVPPSFWLPEHPARDGLASAALRGSSPPDEPKAWRADVWIEHPDSSQYEVYEDCFVPAPDRVIVLLSWGDDESQITDLDED